MNFNQQQTQGLNIVVSCNPTYQILTIMSHDRSEINPLFQVACKAVWICIHLQQVLARLHTRIMGNACQKLVDAILRILKNLALIETTTKSTTWVFPKMVVPPFQTPKWSFLVGKPLVVGETPQSPLKPFQNQLPVEDSLNCFLLQKPIQQALQQTNVPTCMWKNDTNKLNKPKKIYSQKKYTKAYMSYEKKPSKSIFKKILTSIFLPFEVDIHP